jgi:NADH dehydrogenase
MDVVAAFESATRTKLKVRHVPRAALSLGHVVLARIKPEIASLMGMALFSDTHKDNWDDTPMREIGIDPRPASEYVRASGSAGRPGTG